MGGSENRLMPGSGLIETRDPHPVLSHRERGFPLATEDGNESNRSERDNYNRDSVGVPTDATLEWRIEPHAEFVERESRAESIQQRDPEGRTVALEDQCKVSGYRENEDAVHIMMDVHSGNGFPVHSRQNETEKPRADCGQNKCGGNTGRGNSGFWKKHTPESISGGPASRFVTRAPNELNDSERRAEHRRSEKEVRDIFKSIRLEPSDDLPSVEKCQDAFGSESNQAGDEERYEKSICIHFQRAGGENESRKRKRRRHQIQNRKCDCSFSLYFLADLREAAGRDESFQ